MSSIFRRRRTGRPIRLVGSLILAGALVAPALPAATAASASGPAPGAPGTPSTWVPGDKHGFGTARGTASKVWYTLSRGTLNEIYYPRIDTPSSRDTQLVITDGSTFTDREDRDTTSAVRLLDSGSLTYQQVNRARSGKYEITKTYTTDPGRSTVLIDVIFRSLTGRPYSVYILHDPALSMTGDDDTGTSDGAALVASDGSASSALVVSTGFTQSSTGYAGTSDGWTDLRDDARMDWSYRAPDPGNVAQMGRTRLTGLGSERHLTVAIGFGATSAAAITAARGSLAAGFPGLQAGYAAGWHAYLSSLRPIPASARRWGTEYRVSAMVLAASEDKTYRGGFVAAPGRPWAWANVLQEFAVYHGVWSRDLYEIATALIAIGDRAAAQRALDYLWNVQQRPDGSYPQNSRLPGEAVFGGLQLDEVSFPAVLAEQLGRTDAAAWGHVRRAADYVVANGPSSPQERWENLGGFSPATIAAEIAGLVCSADIARRNGAPGAAARYLAVADAWRLNLNRWTLTRNGPLSDAPYYLRITADGNANAGTEIQISDGGPLVDQRRILDPSFLELVRLGVLPPADRNVRHTLDLVDRVLGYATANGPFWHRASFDGYGEQRSGAQWEPTDPGSRLTLGRGWPLLTGERGEYRLAAGLPAQHYLDTMARSADDASYLLPEQVWDQRAPAGSAPRDLPGEPTRSATPLAWTHAQFLRLAAALDAGTPVETPQVVACRYGSPLCAG